MNVNNLFKFKKSQTIRQFKRCPQFHVTHRDSGRWVMSVHYVEAGWLDDSYSYWQAGRNGRTFNAETRAAAVRGLVVLLCRGDGDDGDRRVADRFTSVLRGETR
jgi:hypothetical protein